MGRTEDEEEIDQMVGQNIRTRRVLLGMSQFEVARELGITFQQLQKYEHGSNRVSASRLVSLGRVLHCAAAAFFEGVEQSGVASSLESQGSGTLAGAIDSLSKPQRVAIEKLLETMTGQLIEKRLDVLE